MAAQCEQITAELAERRRRPASAPRRSPRPAACWSGWPPTTSPSWATASTPCCARTARTCCGRCPAPGSGLLRYDQPRSRLVRPADGRGAGQGARPPAADHHQGQLARHGAPLDLPRLRRRQDVRRAGCGDGGAALPGPVHLRGLHRVGAAGADHQGEDRHGPGAVRLHRRQPLRQGPARGPGDLPARRAVPDRRRRALRHRDRGAAPAGAAQDPAVPAQGRVRPVHVLPRLHPPRPLHHGRAAEDGGHPAHRVRRCQRGLHDAGLRVGAGPAALRRPGRPGPADPRRRRGRAAAPAGRRDPHLGRGPRRGGAQRVRRGGRRAPGRALRPGLPRGLQGGLQPARGRGRTCATSRRSSTRTRSG